MASPTDTPRPNPRSLAGPIAAGALLLANVVVPLLFGDLYPFTSAPMFRVAPSECCNYRVLAPDGKELPAEQWLCHRVYDGNPVGYGVGIRPPAVLEQEFGQIHDEPTIRQHIQRILARPEHAGLPSVTVVQEVIGPVDERHVGIVKRQSWRIERPGLLPRPAP
jgi:hypothetical protein